jgi:serine protease Do
MRTRRGSAFGTGLAAFLGLIAGGAIMLAIAWPSMHASSAAAARPSAAGRAANVSTTSEDAIVGAIKKVGPAVVNIDTLFKPPPQTPNDRILRQMGIPTRPFPSAGEGSGIVIDGKKGYILTNAHVVKNAQKVVVSTPGGKQFDATVIGLDPLTEVAVVKVQGDDLPQATLGSPSKLPIGSWVVAIGNPFGFESTVTVGVLSARGREIQTSSGIVLGDLLQTDASINPGNSGGALVDLDGNVIGIPTAEISSAQGIGFAVDMDVAKQVADRLIATGKMPWLGVEERQLRPAEAKQLGLPEGQGNLIVGVVPNGPAASAGMKAGDVITKVGTQAIKGTSELRSAVRSHNVGETLDITLIRNGKEMVLPVKIGAVPQNLGGSP